MSDNWRFALIPLERTGNVFQWANAGITYILGNSFGDRQSNFEKQLFEVRKQGPTQALEGYCLRLSGSFLRAAFKFGRRVHFAVRRKMRKPPITRLPAILNGLQIAQAERRAAFTRI